MQNKKAQIAETTTWIFATLIILVVLIVSVFLSSLVGQNKIFPSTNKFDLFADKSLTSYLLTKDTNGVPIYNEINSEGQLNSFNGNLAQKIFTTLYSGYYNNIFLGIGTFGAVCIPPSNALGTGFCTYDNKYFVSPSTAGNPVADDKTEGVILLIYLINNKNLQLVLWH